MTLLPNKNSMFASQDWATATKNIAPDTIASGPVAPEDYIDASGRCASQASAQSDVAVGTVAGDLGTASAAPQAAAAPTVAGGVALGMTECQVAARAGQPSQVSISADEKSERKVVLTYASGPWPGIYTFSAGRLKDIERVAQPAPAKPVRKKSKSKKPATASAPVTQVR
jgi:hypothetical protein